MPRQIFRRNAVSDPLDNAPAARPPEALGAPAMGPGIRFPLCGSRSPKLKTMRVDPPFMSSGSDNRATGKDNIMKFIATTAATLLAISAVPAIAGHHASHAKLTIVDTAVASPQHETLVAAVKAADLVDALSGPGPLTVFAPTDDAFAKLPGGTVATLLKEENKGQLKAVLTYHVVPGKVSAKELVEMIKAEGGAAALKTLQGGTLTASLDGKNVVITDEKGGKATVVAADLGTSNGLIHVTDAVSLPG